jgi:hypothetical protein
MGDEEERDEPVTVTATLLGAGALAEAAVGAVEAIVRVNKRAERGKSRCKRFIEFKQKFLCSLSLDSACLTWSYRGVSCLNPAERA